MDATKDDSDLIKKSIGGVLDVLEETPFKKLTVRKLLFGYATPLLKLGSDILPPEKRWPHQLFGLFVGVSIKNLKTTISLKKCIICGFTLLF